MSSSSSSVVRRKNPKRSVVLNKRDVPVTKAQVKQMINSIIAYETEDKYWDVNNGSVQPVDYNGIVCVGLTDIVQGDSDTTRDGDSCIIKRLHFAALARYNQVNTTTNLVTSINVLRMIVFVWKPFFADAPPSAAKILTYTGTVYSPFAGLHHDGRDQFVILFDKTVVLDGFCSPAKMLTCDLKLNHKVHWKSGSTTNISGGIYYFTISNAIAAGGLYPELQQSAFRIDFTDA